MPIWNLVGIGTGLIILALFMYLHITNDKTKEEIYTTINKKYNK